MPEKKILMWLQNKKLYDKRKLRKYAPQCTKQKNTLNRTEHKYMHGMRLEEMRLSFTLCIQSSSWCLNDILLLLYFSSVLSAFFSGVFVLFGIWIATRKCGTGLFHSTKLLAMVCAIVIIAPERYSENEYEENVLGEKIQSKYEQESSAVRGKKSFSFDFSPMAGKNFDRILSNFGILAHECCFKCVLFFSSIDKLVQFSCTVFQVLVEVQHNFSIVFWHFDLFYSSAYLNTSNWFFVFVLHFKCFCLIEYFWLLRQLLLNTKKNKLLKFYC